MTVVDVGIIASLENSVAVVAVVIIACRANDVAVVAVVIIACRTNGEAFVAVVAVVITVFLANDVTVVAVYVSVLIVVALLTRELSGVAVVIVVPAVEHRRLRDWCIRCVLSGTDLSLFFVSVAASDVSFVGVDVADAAVPIRF